MMHLGFVSADRLRLPQVCNPSVRHSPATSLYTREAVFLYLTKCVAYGILKAIKENICRVVFLNGK